MDSRHKICIDRILPRNLMRLQLTTRMRGGMTRAIAPIGKTWMNGSTLSVRFMGGTPTEQNIARQQAEWWSQGKSTIRFQRCVALAPTYPRSVTIEERMGSDRGVVG